MRLTKRNADGIACSALPFESSTYDLVDKLAKYEDTGLSPEEIKEKTEGVLELYDKLKPYADAEEQGRLVILPCKVGDIIWFCISERRYFLNPAVYQGIVTELKSVQRMNQSQLILAIVEYNYDSPWKPGTLERSEMHCSFEEYGDWVRFYLTREEAETALKGLKGDTEDV